MSTKTDEVLEEIKSRWGELESNPAQRPTIIKEIAEKVGCSKGLVYNCLPKELLKKIKDRQAKFHVQKFKVELTLSKTELIRILQKHKIDSIEMVA